MEVDEKKACEKCKKWEKKIANCSHLIDSQTLDQSPETSDSDDEKPSPSKKRKLRKKRGRPPKKLGDTDSPPTLKTMGRRTKKFFDEMIDKCEKEDMEFDKFCAYMCRRYYSNGKSTHSDPKKAQIFDDIFNGKDPYEKQKLSPKQGVYLKKELDIGRRRYINLRKFLNPYIHLPNTDELREEENSIRPSCIKVLGGLWWPLPDLVTRQTKDLLEYMVPEIDDKDSPLLKEIVRDGITVKGGGGFDASGRHSTWRY